MQVQEDILKELVDVFTPNPSGFEVLQNNIKETSDGFGLVREVIFKYNNRKTYRAKYHEGIDGIHFPLCWGYVDCTEVVGTQETVTVYKTPAEILKEDVYINAGPMVRPY